MLELCPGPENDKKKAPKMGAVKIDGVDLSKVAIQTIRERVTTIPQDPALFKGTLHFNLDPYKKVPIDRID
jgi:ABC-type multidrug transport system fused ATPase/permease subunit